MTPEQQAVIDRVRARVKEQAMLDAQLAGLDAQDDAQIKAQKQAEVRERVKARLQQKQEPQPEPVTEEPDSFLDNTLDVLGEFSLGANRSAVDALDLVTSPLRGVSNLGAWVAGSDKRMPSFNELLSQTPGAETGFMEEGAAKEAVSALGYTAPIAAGFLPVERASGAASSVVQDILGFGSTTLSANQELAERTAVALQDMDVFRLGRQDMTNPDDIYRTAHALGKKQILERNRPLLEEAEKLEAQRLKEVEKYGSSEIEIPKGVTKVSLKQITDDMYTLYGVEPRDTLKALAKNKGLNYDDDILALKEADKIFKQDGLGTEVPWYDRTFLPVSDLLRRYVSSGVGARFERAVETSTRNVSRITENIGKPIQAVIRQVDKDLELKKMFLDVGRDPAIMPRIIERLRFTGVPEESIAEFRKFVGMSSSRQAEGLQRLYKGDGFDDVYYFHTQKKPKKGVLKPGLGIRMSADYKGENPDFLKNRTRPPAQGMTVEEVAQYENPLVTHLQYLADQELLLELSKKFGLRPSLSRDGNVSALFREIEERLKNDGFDEKIARDASSIMFETYKGAKKAPPPMVRAFMSQAYAGTLAQIKTSILNLHDVAVAVFNQGVRPTLLALIQSNNGQFGKTLQQMGIGDNQAVGEFVQNFDKFQSNPTAMEKLARVSHNVSDFAMMISGFKAMDRIGKGVVIRASLNKARDAAKNGTLVKEYGHLLDRDELVRIRPYLQNRTPASEIPEKARQAIEELVFTGLGEQQLISIAGRPLNYARNPILRPLYALSGFAIKQQALLRRKVGEQLLEGNYSEAGRNAAAYAAFAGLGYGILHEGREALSGKEEFDEEDILVNAVDQIAAAATLNKLGDDYGRTQFLRDPAGFILESFIPPTGIAGATAQDVSDMIFKGEFNAAVAERIPLVGDFYKYYWKE